MSVQIGSIEVLPLLDAVGELGELANLYPEVAAHAWDPYRTIYPELFVAGRWHLPFTCYLVRSPRTTMLVDTGIGPPGLLSWTLDRERKGLLPSALAAHGIDPAEIDLVLLTHLHEDHVGWNADQDGVPCFPRARYLATAGALSFARTRTHLPHLRRCILSLANQLEGLTGNEEISEGVGIFPAPGHHPGHIGVRIRSDGASAVILGDVFPHPALLDRSEWRFASDHDPAQNVETRRWLLDELTNSETVAICGHYPCGGVGLIADEDGRIVWKPLGTGG